ncbi:MAG: FAD-binding oxidoreductase [Dehalococcoidia bacterium]|nr:FAD-binding oxidoreductase [Dehalococcoidia bacterium]
MELAKALRSVVKGEVRFDAYSRALYSTDASIYQMEPVGLVVPRDAEDVAATVCLAYETGTPILPRGGGTSLAGQCVNHAIVLDFSKAMAGVLEVNAEEQWARVQPGVNLDELNAALASSGLMFAPDPASSNRATVGGVLGNNSCGSHSALYGKAVDHVLQMSVVLSDGTVTTVSPLDQEALVEKQRAPGLEGDIYRRIMPLAESCREEVDRRYPKILRRVSGYNLDELLKSPINVPGLLVGSEGTLATMLEAKVRLVRRPTNTVLAVLHFRSLLEALDGAVWLLRDGEPVAAMELIDRNVLLPARTQLALSRRMGFLDGDPGALLVVELVGDDPAELEARLDSLAGRAARARIGSTCVKLTREADQQDVWAVRRAGVGLLMGAKGDTKPIPFVEDTAVPPARLPEYVRRFDELVRAHGTTAAYYGHASVGCLHIRPLINLKLDEGVQRMAAIADGVADLVLEYGGSLSGEHGDGIVRGGFTERMFGAQLTQAFRDLKRAFDPKGIMNPGKIVDCPPLTENLRAGFAARARHLATGLDFAADGGFVSAVEQCNGQGACRKTVEGVMCPSYMVTREEEHSTRGRANALRAVLSGVLPPSELTSKRLHQVLDLCLECKACKAECPSNVDMAKLKYELLDHYYRAHGRSLRARLFANVAGAGRLGSATAPVSTWVLRSWPGRLALAGLGVHPGRKLPPFARQTFREWFHRNRKPHPLAPSPCNGEGGRPSTGAAALFVDTFMNYNYPSIGKAATALIERAGYQLTVPRVVCCGRPFLASGMLERAREHARRNVDALYPLAQAGVQVVGCEPSCLLMFRDEYLDLLPGDERARAVARNVMMLDEFLARLPDQARARLVFRHANAKVLLQPHCHQRALAGTDASMAALRMAPGAEVEVLDAGCCGMAGAFGYEKEHYEVSMKIGERRLFPAVRGNPDATVVVTGVSCRQQVEHGVPGARPQHLAEWLAEQLEGRGKH